MIVTILIGFGFVLADNLHVRQNLQETENIIAEARSLEDEAIRNLEACQIIVSNQESELQVLRFETMKHLERITQLESDNVNLGIKNDQLQTSQPDDDVKVDPIATIIIVITQIALFFIQKLQQAKLGFHTPFIDNNNNKGQSVCLTKEELKIIIEMRRKK